LEVVMAKYIPANTGFFTWTVPERFGGGGGSFRPNGKIRFHGNWKNRDSKENPEEWWDAGGLSARFFLGFNVGDKPTYSVDDAIPVVRDELERLLGNPSSSFITQKGIYKSKITGNVVEEDGVQIVVFDETGHSNSEWKTKMAELAKTLVREFQQEAVFVQLQKNGQQISTGMVTA